MTYRDKYARSGLAAIAAVLALSSTPLFAQEVTTPPDPVAETPTEPAPAADPPAPEPTASEPAASEPAASDAVPEAKPATTAAPTPSPQARSRTTAMDRVSSERAPTTAAPRASQPSEAVETVPVPPPGELPAVTDPFAPAGEPVVEVDEPVADEALPIAGAAGLALLGLGGIGLAVQRRRNRREELAHQKANQRYLDEHPDTPAPVRDEPAFIAAGRTSSPVADVRTDVPRTKLPKDFDLSRFGPHVQAAYLGPTPDNPSLSLKHRLRRAGAMDQRARLEAENRPQAGQSPNRPEPAKRSAWTANGEDFMFRRSETSKQPSKPAFQH